MTSPADSAATFCATLVDEWVGGGVRHAMVSPGSRSTPMALALLRHPAIHVEMFHDERSASFAGLGAGLASGVPAVILCSSGTAATHFHAAVVEAHQSNVPMIVCTADRPARLHDIAAPQTIDQTKMYGAAVRWFHDPGVPDMSGSHAWRALAARALASTLGSRPGPVHLNLPFDEPLYGEASTLPEARGERWSVVRRADRFPDADIDEIARMLDGRRGVFVAGKGAPASIVDIAEQLGWPVLADSRARVGRSHRLTVTNFDPILRSGRFVKMHAPDMVVQVGESPASKVLAQWLKSLSCPIQHWSDVDMVTDPLHVVGTFLRGDIDGLCRRLAARGFSASPEWSDGWSVAQRTAAAAIDATVSGAWSEVAASRTASRCIPPGSHVVVSSSMPVRDLEWFGALPDDVVVHSNRGANGIDGVVATGLGAAVATGATTFVLIGDVALLHDASSLTGMAARGLDVRVVVTNNDGGSIFSFLPQAAQVSAGEFETMYGTPHGTDFASLCHAHGIRHETVTDADSLRIAMSHSGPIVIEAPFDRSVNVSAHDAVNAAVVAALDAVTA